MLNGSLKSRELLNRLKSSFLKADVQTWSFFDKKSFSPDATIAIGTNPLGGNTFQKQLFISILILSICDIRINVHITPCWAAFLRPNIPSFSRSTFFMVLTARQK